MKKTTCNKRKLIICLCLVVFAFFFIASHFYRGYIISFYEMPHFSIPVNESSVTFGGYRFTLTGLKKNGESVNIHYSVERVALKDGEDRLVFMRPFGRIKVTFLDSRGNEQLVASDTPEDENRARIPYVFGDFAISRFTYLHEDEAEVILPYNAKYITLTLSKGLTTNKVIIPE